MPQRNKRVPIVTLLLIFINVAFFLIETAKYGNTDMPLVLFSESFDSVLVANGEWWRMVTSLFTHFGGEHLAAELLPFLAIGYVAENSLGRMAFLADFLICGLAGNLSALLCSLVRPFDDILSGGTAAITGVVLTYLVAALGTPNGSWTKLLPVLGAEALMLYFCNGAGMDAQALLGGILAGVILGFVFRRKRAAALS